MPKIDMTLARAAAHVGLAIGATGLTIFFVLTSWADGRLGVDMVGGLLPAAQRIVEGASPFSSITYPPLVPFLLVPFTFLPSPGDVLAVLALACVPTSLWALGVRDWRCYAAAFLWAPIFSGVQTANPTLFVLLASSLAWRHRNLPAAAAASCGIAIAAKVISAPLALWLVVTKRIRAGWGAVTVAAGVTGALVAVDRFALERGSDSWGIATVPGAESSPSYGVVDIVRLLGGGTAVGLVALAVAAVVPCLLTIRYGRRDDDTAAFASAAVATLLIAPNVWLHSFSFLLLAVAVRRPRFTAAWLVPGLFWVIPVGSPRWSDTLIAWGLSAALVVAVLLRASPQRTPAKERAASCRSEPSSVRPAAPVTGD